MKFSRYIPAGCFISHQNARRAGPLITSKTSYLYVKALGPVFFLSGSRLLSHAVPSIVSSAAYVLTIVFGMWTGVSHKRIATGSSVTNSH